MQLLCCLSLSSVVVDAHMLIKLLQNSSQIFFPEETGSVTTCLAPRVMVSTAHFAAPTMIAASFFSAVCTLR